MSIQGIIVAVIILVSVTYTVYSFIQVFVKKAESSCGGCSCDIKSNTKDIKSIIHKNLS